MKAFLGWMKFSEDIEKDKHGYGVKLYAITQAYSSMLRN